MKHHRIAALLAAAALALPAVPALAQTADQPAAASTAPKAAPAKKAHKRAAAKASPRPAAAAAVPSIVPSPLGADGDPSLERRRRAFFGSKPDAGGPSAPDAPVGVTLGGGNGLTPGMGMKF